MAIKAGETAFKAALGAPKMLSEAVSRLTVMGWLIRGPKALGNGRSLAGYGLKQEGVGARVFSRHTACRDPSVWAAPRSKQHQNSQH